MATNLLKGLAHHMVRRYPRAWRQRYAEEVLDVLDQHRVTLRTVANLMANAAAARLDPAYRRDPFVSSGARRALRLSGFVVGTLLLLGVAGSRILTDMEPTEFGVTGAHDVSFSADGRLVLTSGGDGALRLWDLTDPARPTELSRFRGGDNVSLSPDGRTIASLEGSVILWDVSDPGHPRKAASLFDPRTDPEAAVFSRDGRLLATGYHESIVLFDVTDPARPVQLTALPAHPRSVPPQTFMTMRFSPDGRTLATTSGDADGMTLWDVSDPAHPTERAVLPHERTVPGPKYDVMTFTPDGATLATADSVGRVTLWNVADPGRPSIASMVDTSATEGGRMGLRTNVLEVVIGGDGRTMVTVMNNVKASVWDITDRVHPRHVRDVIRDDDGPGIYRISPDGRVVVSAARPDHDTITVWAIG